MARNSIDNRPKRERYEAIYSTLWNEMQTFQPQWRDLANFVKPSRLRRTVMDRNKGDRRNLGIVDSTASFSLRTLQAGMHAGLTSPSRPWFALDVPDPDLRKFRPVKNWLYDATVRMHAVMLKSNIYTALPTIYADQGLFATGTMGLMDDDRDLFRCYPYPIGTYALGLSRRQTVDTFVREYTMTVRQLVEEFGDVDEHGQPDWSRFSNAVKTLYDKSHYEESVEVCWVVAPNVGADQERLGAQFKPFFSCHFEKGGKNDVFLRESGFDEFPIVAPRWDAAAEDVFGTDSPGMTALGDVRGLQTQAKRKAQAVEKSINPPVTAPTHLRTAGVNLLPGGVNYVDMLQQQQGIRPVQEIRLDIDHMRADIADVRMLIKQAFYEPLFLMLASADPNNAPDMTAREVQERHEEKLLALGPVIERNNDELHEPVIDRVYALMARAGMIPPPPPELEGIALKVEYLSIMAQAQKMVGATALRNFLQDALPIVQAFPEGRFKISPFKIMDELGDRYGIPPGILVDDDEAHAALDAAQKRQAAQQQAEVAATMAKAGKDLGTTPMDENTALTRVMQGASR